MGVIIDEIAMSFIGPGHIQSMHEAELIAVGSHLLTSTDVQEYSFFKIFYLLTSVFLHKFRL